MRQHDAAIAFAVKIGVDAATILGGKGNVLLRGSRRREQETDQNHSKNSHGADYTFSLMSARLMRG